MFSIFVLLHFFKISQAVTGFIWDNSIQNFIPLFQIPNFAQARDEYTRKLRNIEFHNFHGEALKLAYFEVLSFKINNQTNLKFFVRQILLCLINFQEGNLVSFIDNDTKITGVCGEIWNNLADYLNFT